MIKLFVFNKSIIHATVNWQTYEFLPIAHIGVFWCTTHCQNTVQMLKVSDMGIKATFSKGWPKYSNDHI